MATLSVRGQSMSVGDAVAQLKTHLDAIVGVEFFTIPVYLTAVYSFTDQALGYVDAKASASDPQQPLYDMQQKTLSVAIQEMYHLQLACNLCNALYHEPAIPTETLAAGTSIKVPNIILADGNPLTLELGNLPEAIQAMVDIETPDPNHVYPAPNDTATYASISDLYHATFELIMSVAQASLAQTAGAPDFSGGKQVSYATFTNTYKYNTVTDEQSAVNAVNAITDQGEGNEVETSQFLQTLVKSGMLKIINDPDGNVACEFQPASGTRFSAYGAWAHHERFTQLQTTLASANFTRWNTDIQAAYAKLGVQNLGAFYEPNQQKISVDIPSWLTVSADDVQTSLNAIWSYITSLLQSGFASGKLTSDYAAQTSDPSFTEAMIAFKYVTPLRWKFGYAPSYTYDPNVKPADAQKAMDTVDPFSLFHWDERTRTLRSQKDFIQNICQGLNQCKGMGWGGIATQPGDGACATVEPHTCGGNNSCQTFGACGFLSTNPQSPGDPCATAAGSTSSFLPTSAQWIPGYNSCNGLGGCQVPIATEQVLSSYQVKTIYAQSPIGGWTRQAKSQLAQLGGTSVWDRARFLLADALGNSLPQPQAKEVDGINYDGTIRRAHVEPTSTT